MKPRIEQKLAITRSEYPLFLKWISNCNGEILYPSRLICSRYFDNYSLEIFSDTLDGNIPRKKIRVRTYDVRQFFSNKKNYLLEFKQSSQHARLKESKPCVSIDEVQEMCKSGIYDKQYGLCFPVVDISYLRHYFLVQGKRITIDEDIQYESISPDLTGKITKAFDEEMVLEIKTDFKYDVNKLLNLFEFPRTRFSKYERAIDSLQISPI